MRAAALAMALLLAGCLGAPPAPPGPDPQGSASFRWDLHDCTWVAVNLPADPQRLQAHLPEGFTPAAGGLVGTAGGGTFIDLDAYQCAAVTGLAGPLPDVAYGSAYVRVEVPEERRVEGYDAYFVKWDFLVPDAPRRAAFTRLGLPAVTGEAEVPPAAAGPYAARLALDGGAGGFALQGALAQPLEAGRVPFVEFTPLASGGLARWNATAAYGGFQGAGVVTLAPGWVADVVGQTQLAVTFAAGPWELTNATMVVPAP